MQVFICHGCGASFDKISASNLNNTCKFCNNALIEEEVEFENTVQGWKKVEQYAFETYLQGDPVKELNYEKQQVQSKQEFAEFNKKLEELRTPKCPRCGSKFITTGQRGFSIWTGFIGSDRTVNRCGNCGHKWEPKRR